MELEFDRDAINSYETVLDVTLCQEETLEAIVPDACPDILRIIDVCGQAALSSKVAKDGIAVVTGLVRAVVIYQPEEGSSLRRMEVNLPFACQGEAAGLTQAGTVLASPRLRYAEARALNPRKVLLRVDLAVDVSAYQPIKQPICRGVVANEKNALCQRQVQKETYQLSAVQEKPFTFSEEVRLQVQQGDGNQLLALRATPICTESKLIGSKLIFKGQVELYLLRQEGRGAIISSHESLPFSQIMEILGAGESGDCQVQVELTQLEYQPDSGDGRTLSLTLELLAQAKVLCRRPITLLQDLYSTAWQTEVDSQLFPICRLGEQAVRPQTIRELLELGEMVASVVESRLSLGQVRQNREGNQLVLTVDSYINVLYLNEVNALQCVRRSIPVICRLDCGEEYQCTCTCSCPSEVFASPTAGGIETRFSVEFHYLTTCRTKTAVVKGARLGEARGAGEGQRPSMILRMAAQGEDVWDIAKAYGTSQGKILQANELEGDELPEGRMLLIPNLR